MGQPKSPIENIEWKNFQNSCVGAGALEELLSNHGEKFIERIEKKTDSDKNLLYALSCMYQNRINDEIWDKIQKIVHGQ